MAEWFVAKASELPDGDRRIVVAGKEEIGVFHQGGTYYAYSNYCVHSGGPACEGILINKVVDLIVPTVPIRDRRFPTRCILSAPGTATNMRSPPAAASATAG